MNTKTTNTALNNLFPILLVGITLLTLFYSYVVWLDIKDDKYKDLEYTASVINKYYEFAFYQRETGLIGVGKRMLEIEGENQAAERLEEANNALKLYTDFLAFGLADTTGQLIVFTGSMEGRKSPPNLAASPQTQRTFNQAKRASGLVIGEVYYFDEVSGWIMPIRVPIRNVKGELQAVNTSAIDFRQLIAELKDLEINEHYKVNLINSDYNTVQIYYPLKPAQYNNVLKSNTELVYTKIDTVSYTHRLLRFNTFNEVESHRSIGVQTTSNKYKHHVIVSVSQSLVWAAFWERLQRILTLYVFIVGNLIFLFKSLRKKEKSYIEKIKSERDYYTKIINCTHTIIVGMDNKYRCTFLNPAGEKIGGYQEEEVMGKSYFKKLYPDELYRQVEKALVIFEAHGELKNHEMTLVTKEGNYRLISWSTISFSNETGALKEIICFGVDITEKKQAENSIRMSEANLKSLFENTNDIIGLFDKNLHLIEFNQPFAFNSKQTDGIELYKGIPILDIMNKPQAKVFRGFLSRALNGEKLSKIVEYPTESGEKIYFKLSYNPIEQENGEVTGVAMYVQDISELKNAQNELRQYSEKLEFLVKNRTAELEDANEGLKEKNEELKVQREELKVTIENLKQTQSQLIHAEKMASLGVLAAGVGHEINNPLNFIKGGAGGIEIHLKNLSDEKVASKVKPFIKIINEGVDRASTIVKSLRHFSRQGVNMYEECNIHDIINNCLVILHNKTKHKVEIIKNFSAEPVIVHGNEGKLHQAFLNILANAEQAIQESGIIKISTHNLAEDVVISFYDNGCGIDKNHLDKISDPFFTTKSPGEGTGLGLSITYNIIKEHSGSINVKSSLGKETEFIVMLPKKN